MKPGDIVCGDIDGVVVVPSSAATDIVQAALAKVAEDIFTRTGIM